MLHVKQIRQIVDRGETEEAHEALDQLLALGPQNTEGLKLRAQLFAYEGRFGEEAKVWERIATIDREDPDAVSYLLRKQLEDREHFYFTDDLPGGGRRFMAYPRGLVQTSALGLAGCVAFLITTRLALRFPVLTEPAAMLSLFGVLVLLPWVGILYAYVRSIKSVSLSAEGVAIATRIRVHSFKWADLDRVCLARTMTARGPQLSLVLVPKEAGAKAVEIDLNPGSTAIRARSYLIREVSRFFSQLEYSHREKIELGRRKVALF